MLERCFNEANEAILAKDVPRFASAIHELMDNLTCNCYLKNKNYDIYRNQLAIINSLRYNPLIFDINFSKGFLYFVLKDADKAYLFLSKAISINPVSSLSYALRASISHEVNKNCYNDAVKATLLNPTATNYFILANICAEDESATFDEAIEYFSKAIELNSNFSCAYNNRSNLYKKNNKLSNAIEDLKECVKLDPNHWAYFHLSKYLAEENRYKEAIYYAKIGLQKDSKNKQYNFQLGHYYYAIREFEHSLDNFRIYLQSFPDSESTKQNINACEKLINEKQLQNARNQLTSGNYEESQSLYQQLIENGIVLEDFDLEYYFLSVLLAEDESISIDEDNVHYQRLSLLRKSYISKIAKCIEVTEEEENANKLMRYGINYHIGFGNYEKQKICDIAEIDPHYILWCIVNLEHFSIENSVFLKYDFCDDLLYLQAIEMNLIKQFVLEYGEEGGNYGYSLDKFNGSNDFNDSYEDSSFCPACQESPCMCSDPGW